MNSRLFAGLGLVCLLIAGSSVPAQAQTAVSDFSSAPASGQFSFASATPASLPELLRPDAPKPAASVVGHLFMPEGTAPVPAVILIHGSGGIYEAMLDFWPKTFNAAGIAVFSVDSFGPRGVKSTADDQSQVPFAADTQDAFAALKLLATHPRIDRQRIAVMGFSRGGITAWRTAVERIANAQRLPDGLRFAAHIPVYSGGCVGVFRLIVKPGVFSKAPELWIHGSDDDYAYMAPCQDYAKRIGEAGTPVEFVVIPGARHKFDYDDPKRVNVRGAQKTKEGCPLELDIATLASYNRNTGQRLSGDEVRAVQKEECSALGASVEGDRKARAMAAEAAVRFLKQTFKL